LRTFCENEVDPTVIERDAALPDRVFTGLAELGALGMKIDTEYGGLGLSQVDYNRALMLAGSAHPAIATLLSAHQSMGVPQPLALFGTDDQKRRFLPRCARSDISAFLLTEPDVGSDPARLHATAIPTEDGSAYVLDGVKLWTTNGVIADLLVVMARVPQAEGHRGGITAFVVEADSPGITVEARNAFMGLRGIENGLTRFDRVRVPAGNRIGAEGQGLKIALTTLNTGRLSLPAICAGAAKWCTKIAREWSREQVQWGRPIGEHDAVAGKDARRLDLGLRAGDPLPHGTLGHQEGAGDLGHGQPAEHAQRQRHAGFHRQRRVAAGEDQPQAVVVDGAGRLGRVVVVRHLSLPVLVVALVLAPDPGRWPCGWRWWSAIRRGWAVRRRPATARRRSRTPRPLPPRRCRGHRSAWSGRRPPGPTPRGGPG
jgi:hypothetical protein